MKRLILYLTISLILILGQVLIANAWDGVITGNIQRIDITDGGNYGFKLFLVGYPALCSQGSNYAFLLDTDSNYKTYVAVLLAAKISNIPVTLYTYNYGSGCHIGYIALD